MPTLTVERYGSVTRAYWGADGALCIERSDPPSVPTPEELHAQIAAFWEPRAVTKTSGLTS